MSKANLLHNYCGIQEGLANLCLVGSSCTLQRARIETNMPRKRGAAAAGYDKALESFFRKVGNGPSSLGCQLQGVTHHSTTVTL